IFIIARRRSEVGTIFSHPSSATDPPAHQCESPSAPSAEIVGCFFECRWCGTEIGEQAYQRLFTRDVAVRAESRATVLGHRVDVPAFAMLEVDEDAHRESVAPEAFY